jgi:site-specific DNA recombinase
LETIQAYAQEAGMRLSQVFKEEGISGTTDETQRPAFQELMAAVLGNGVRTIIVESMDRLARELRIQEALLVYLASKGVNLISARTAENITQAVQADPLKRPLCRSRAFSLNWRRNQLVRRLKKA